MNNQLVGESESIKAIHLTISKIAETRASVLITGPSGTGKDVVARLIHQCSSRAAEAFVPVNCAAIPRELLESEIFGHKVGAFTGAKASRRGRFEAAHHGTLFLDEIGDMPTEMQVKLLRILDTQIVEPIGSVIGIPVDVRVVAATNADLEGSILSGRFREDLFYRLNVVEIRMLPLKERKEDIPLLLKHFIALETCADRRITFSATAILWLSEQNWRGNVRELKNFVERATALYAGQEISCDLAKILMMRSRQPLNEWLAAPPRVANEQCSCTVPFIARSISIDLKTLLNKFEQSHIEEALTRANGTIAETARSLGLRRTTLIEKMRRLQIERPLAH